MSMQLKDIKSTDWGLDIYNQGEVVQGLKDIKQCVNIILTTQKGTDPLRPDFGCDVYKFVDNPVNNAIPNMKKAIIGGLTKYEPRIEKIEVTHQLVVSKITFLITYKIKNTVLTDSTNQTYGS